MPVARRGQVRAGPIPRPDGTFYIAAPMYQCQSCTVMFGNKDVFMKLKGTVVQKDPS